MDDLLFHSLAQRPGRQQQESPEIEVLTEEQEDEDTPWRVILYDDDVHTFDEVIKQLIKALGCDTPAAEKLTLKIHTEGKAKVYEGTFEDCFQVNSVLKEIELITEIKG